MSIAPQVSPAMEIAFAGFAAAIVEPPEACKLGILYNKFLDGIERESRSWRERFNTERTDDKSTKKKREKPRCRKLRSGKKVRQSIVIIAYPRSTICSSHKTMTTSRQIRSPFRKIARSGWQACKTKIASRRLQQIVPSGVMHSAAQFRPRICSQPPAERKRRGCSCGYSGGLR